MLRKLPVYLPVVKVMLSENGVSSSVSSLVKSVSVTFNALALME